MKYIMRAREFHLILSANGSLFLNWWIGVSYAVHTNMWGHTGGELSMGRIFTIVTLTKKKINTRSSTESEIFGVHDCMPA